jgi:DNA-binding HxlR family transcriptional regulator
MELMQRTRFDQMACSIARTIDVAAEPWSLLIVRDVWVGIRRFDELQHSLGISRRALAERLRWLCDHDVLERQPYSERPVRHEYALTPRGQGFADVLLAISAWGDRWTSGPEGPPVLLTHATCGSRTHAEIHCASCGEALHAADVVVEPGPGARPPAEV